MQPDKMQLLCSYPLLLGLPQLFQEVSQHILNHFRVDVCHQLPGLAGRRGALR